MTGGSNCFPPQIAHPPLVDIDAERKARNQRAGAYARITGLIHLVARALQQQLPSLARHFPAVPGICKVEQENLREQQPPLVGGALQNPVPVELLTATENEMHGI